MAALSTASTEYATTLSEVKDGMTSKIQQFTQAMALMAKQRTRRTTHCASNKRCRCVRYESSSKEESNDEEKEPSLPPKPKTKHKKTK